MDREEIIEALTALAHRLHRRGVHGEMYVVGGAAIALAYSARRSTRDVDAVFESKMAIYQAAGEVADELGLPAGWLNDAVKGFLAGDGGDLRSWEGHEHRPVTARDGPFNAWRTSPASSPGDVLQTANDPAKPPLLWERACPFRHPERRAGSTRRHVLIAVPCKR